MNIIQKVENLISLTIGKINWTSKKVATAEELKTVHDKLISNYYIIMTRHNGHLSTYAISLAHFLLTGRWGYYGHVLMNLEDTVDNDDDFRLIEAIGTGVTYSPFNRVFDNQCSSVALLKPKSMSLEYWTTVLDRAKTELGKPYDTLFDLSNDRALSCVELVRVALQKEPNYATDFANFESMIVKSKNLDPQMFYECPDFEIVYEFRH
jgi:hypothetical protein